MNQNEQQPERTAIQQAIESFSMQAYAVLTQVEKDTLIRCVEQLKKLRDTVEKEQLITAYNKSWQDFPCTDYTGEDWYNEKYTNHGK